LDLGELAAHLGEGLVEASRLLVVQSIGVTADKTALLPKTTLVVSKAVRPGKACLSTTL